MRENQKTGRSRTLRQESTLAERLVWSRPRDGRMNGRKFRRQHPIGPYIADFCCLELMLVVELDGSSHEFREDEDRRREGFLRERGYRVVRIRNEDVYDNFKGVLEALWEMTGSSPGDPSP